jgi:hypothetical protein
MRPYPGLRHTTCINGPPVLAEEPASSSARAGRTNQSCGLGCFGGQFPRPMEMHLLECEGRRNFFQDGWEEGLSPSNTVELSDMRSS